MQTGEKVTSVIDKWLAAVVNTDARLLATVRLSSLVSCSTRWYLRRRHQQVFYSLTKNSSKRQKLTRRGTFSQYDIQYFKGPFDQRLQLDVIHT